MNAFILLIILFCCCGNQSSGAGESNCQGNRPSCGDVQGGWNRPQAPCDRPPVSSGGCDRPTAGPSCPPPPPMPRGQFSFMDREPRTCGCEEQ